MPSGTTIREMKPPARNWRRSSTVASSILSMRKRETMHAVVRDKFALVRVDLFDQVVEFFEEGGVIQLRPGARDGFARKPAALVVRIKDFEIVAFDFDDQPQLLGKLKLVSIVVRIGSKQNRRRESERPSTLSEPSAERANELRNRLQIDMRVRSARCAVRVAPHFELSGMTFQRVVRQQASDSGSADIQQYFYRLQSPESSQPFPAAHRERRLHRNSAPFPAVSHCGYRQRKHGPS